jgi:hypothetical protein
MLVLFTAQADLPWIGFLRSMMAGALNPSGDSRMSVTSMVMVFVPAGMSEPFSSAPACPVLRLGSRPFVAYVPARVERDWTFPIFFLACDCHLPYNRTSHV